MCHFNSLSPEDKALVGRCLRVAAEGELLPHWEIPSLFGLELEEVRRAADAWPNRVLNEEVHIQVVRAAVGNLIHYPHGRSDELESIVGADREELRRLAKRLSSKEGT